MLLTVHRGAGTPMLKTSLRYLMCVARHGSIRAASAELNIAQSAISRRLQALEHQVGTPLFERKPRGVVLTEAGELLYAHCQSSSFAIERLYSEIDALNGLMRGKVRVASMESAVSSLLSDAMDSFRKQHPNINFSIDIATSDVVLETVRKGDVDFGLTLGADFSKEIHINYQVKEPFLAAMKPEHPLARRKSVSIEELTRWPLALAPPASGSRMIFETCCSHAGIAVKPALETNSVDLMRSFAVAGTGITPMIRYAARASVAKGDLVALPIAGKAFVIDVSVISLEERKLPLASERFLATIIERLKAPARAFRGAALRAT